MASMANYGPKPPAAPDDNLLPDDYPFDDEDGYDEPTRCEWCGHRYDSADHDWCGPSEDYGDGAVFVI